MTNRTSSIHPLRAYRSLHEVSASDLAKKLGVTEAALRHWENGIRSIKATKCVEIEKLIGIDRAILRPDLFRREAA